MSVITNHTISVTVAGVDRTANLSRDSLFIRSNIGNTNDIAEFTLIDDGTFQITDWTTVIIEIDSVRVFGGYITSSSGIASGDANNKTTFWSVECRDWSALFDTVVVNREYTDSADNAIVDNLFDTYLASDGFDSTTNVITQYDDVDIVFDYITLREALDQLAELVKAEWHVDPDKSIYWYGVIDPSNAAFNIDTVSPNDSTTFDVLAGSLNAYTDSLEIVNKLQIIGGYAQAGTLQTDEFTGVADEFIYGPLTEVPSSIWSIAFTDEDDNSYTLYASDIGTYPSTIVDDDGNVVYADDGDYYVIANLDTQYISFDPDTPYPKAGSTITVKYYYKEPVIITREDTSSQAQYGRVFERTIFDESLNDLRMATRYADQILNEYSYGRVTVRFDVARHGLLPGRLISINTPAFNISTVLGGLLWLDDRGGYITLESEAGNVALENYDNPRYFLIQEVSIQTITTQQDEFAIIATVTAGRWVKSLADSVRQQQASQYKTNLRTGNRSYGSLSQITGNLGEVVSGKALFTDGGTAQFQWTDYGGHTGAIVGLEDTGQPAPYGAAYILQDGAPRAKLGKLGTELPSVGTVVPDGWGLWTNNGYFAGAITATAGEIGGWTIADNAIIGNQGTIATSQPPLNSSNPGVYMSTAGIYGYGTLGLTFALPADPAQRPVFSSGTILETVYEVTNAAVIRTGTTLPRVQIDNSGIFAYNGAGTALFTVDSSTGRMTATDGIFSGSVTASTITGGTVTGAVFSGGTVSQGTISASVITGGTVNGGVVQSGTGFPKVRMDSTGIFGYDAGANPKFYVNSATGKMTATDGTFSGTVSASLVSGGTVSASLFTGGTVSAVGGSVRIDDDGISLATAGSSPLYGDQRFISYLDPGSGSVVAAIGGIGGSSTNRGTVMVHAYDRGIPNKYSEMLMTPDVVSVALYSAPTYTSVLSATTTYVRFARNVEPSLDATYSNGRSGARWLEVWAANGTIQTSDERKKKEIADSDLGLEFIERLRAISWLWRDIDDGRRHHGLSAQAVRAVLDELGAGDFAGYLYDAESDVHSLQYSEFIAPLIAAIQELARRVEFMEEQWQTAR